MGTYEAHICFGLVLQKLKWIRLSASLHSRYKRFTLPKLCYWSLCKMFGFSKCCSKSDNLTKHQWVLVILRYDANTMIPPQWCHCIYANTMMPLQWCQHSNTTMVPLQWCQHYDATAMMPLQWCQHYDATAMMPTHLAQVRPSPSNTISGRLGSVSGGLGPFFGGF